MSPDSMSLSSRQAGHSKAERYFIPAEGLSRHREESKSSSSVQTPDAMVTEAALAPKMQPKSNSHVDIESNPQERSKCLLLRLPADIRNIIYDFVFSEPQGIHLDLSRGQCFGRFQNHLALALTCRQLYNDCHGLPCWLNVVHFHAPVLQDMEGRSARTYPLERWPTMQLSPDGFPSLDPLGKDLSLRRKAQEFVYLAVQPPNTRDIVYRLQRVIEHPGFLPQVRRAHINLGSQANNTFVEGFFYAWSEVETILHKLSTQVELRISSEMRFSKRLVVAYDFEVTNPEETLANLDRCVKLEGTLTLPELSSINAVRLRVWKTFFERNGPVSKPGPFFIGGVRQESATLKRCVEPAKEVMHCIAVEELV